MRDAGRRRCPKGLAFFRRAVLPRVRPAGQHEHRRVILVRQGGERLDRLRYAAAFSEVTRIEHRHRTELQLALELAGRCRRHERVEIERWRDPDHIRHANPLQRRRVCSEKTTVMSPKASRRRRGRTSTVGAVWMIGLWTIATRRNAGAHLGGGDGDCDVVDDIGGGCSEAEASMRSFGSGRGR